ncbi:hypothetical protein [Paraburkholderia fungorum]|uniref:hypothetical protein n=1 Tax=Paraburkholderia fungorum TaxID=134537 RepID=UPI000B139F87|nr:hypothetical protein [Paraburkholderia fungorum]MBB5546616.1 hypothetical protein [Paraburkholderia fungorum]
MFKIVRVDWASGERTYVDSRDDRDLAYAIVELANYRFRSEPSVEYYYDVEE